LPSRSCAMHPAIIGTVRSLIVDVAMGQIPRSTERISSFHIYFESNTNKMPVFLFPLNIYTFAFLKSKI